MNSVPHLTPALSIVVATGATAGNRDACLAAATAQRLPDGDLEIVDLPLDGDLGRAWNLGAVRATGRTLLFLRDDVMLTPTAAAEHMARVRDCPRDLVVGPTRVDAGTDGLSIRYAEHTATISPVAACAGQTLAMQRELFRESGGFATGLDWGAEVELAFRLSRRGAALVQLPQAAGTRRLPRTLRQVATLLEREGKASVELYRRHPGLLPLLQLGAFATAGEGALILRRALLAAGGPVAPLGPLGALLPAGDRRDAWHRFLCDYFYWRGVRAASRSSDLWRRLARGPVILMYHAIGSRGEPSGCYIVPIRRFEHQIRWLKLAGYHVLGVDELLRLRREHRLPPARSVAITFDDGYCDNATLATPALARLGLTATFFLVTDRLGAANDWDRTGELAGRPLVAREDVRRMLESGMSIGAHTRTHPVLPELSPSAATTEVQGARRDLDRELGVTVESFAYPYGRFDESTRDAVEHAGYRGACCSRSGVNDPVVSPFLLRRLEVRGTDSLLRFALGVRRGRARRRAAPGRQP